MIIFAVLSKVIGCGIGARMGGLSKNAALHVGVGMVSRGEVALVIAGAGLAGGLLDAAAFSMLIVVTLATTLITPPLLRLINNPPSFQPMPDNMSLAPVVEPWQDYILDKQV
jgi:Kef-type K+ transport system membrane component KefB